MEDDIPDPSDWLATKTPYLEALETSMRCNICKEVFRAPLLTSCSHTFCSICIRKCLQTDSKCPICRHDVQVSTLRKNQAVEDITEIYTANRPRLLELVKSMDSGFNEPSPSSEQRSLANKHISRPAENITSQKDHEKDHVEDLSEVSEDMLRRSKRIKTQETDPAYGFCPSCNEYMKIRDIEGTHLTDCLNGDVKNKSIIDKRQPWIIGKPMKQASESGPEPDLHKKLPLTSYNFLSEKKLRELLSRTSLSTAGSRDILERRHREWVTLWNANADSRTPESQEELRKKIKQWEQTLNNKNDDVNLKELDKHQWSKEHSDDFMDLIAKAKNSSNKAASK